jgi:MinD-like ATPase involved in chromosome partitioning or flagellar assembly
MLVACWSAKGGSGTTVVSVALAAVLARTSPSGAVVADLAGDVPTVLGLPEPAGPGLAEWFAAGEGVPPDALARLEVDAPAGLRVLPAGSAVADSPAVRSRAEVLAVVLGEDRRPVVADCGSGPSGPGLALAAAASVSLLVLRPCYLALRRALVAPVRASGVVLVQEPGRALGRTDVEDVLGIPVRAVVDLDPAIARAVDAGLFPARLPRSFERALRHAA